MIRDKDGKVIRKGTRSRGNVFPLNPIEMTYLVSKVDDSWLWHKTFFHIKFEIIVKTSSMVAIRDVPNILKPTNIV